MTDLDRAFTRPRKAARAAKLAGVEESLWYGMPALKVNGKGFMRVKDQDTLVFRCALEEKELLMEAAPEIYFETDHYKGWAAVLVRLSAISDAELRQCVERAWRLVAPKTVVDASAAKAAKAAPKKKTRRKN
jgi:hypothetical protein